MDGVVIRPCLPFHEEARTAGPLCSTGTTPRPRSYGPFRLPLAVGRLPGLVARPTLVRRFRGGARRVSPVDFTRPCRRAAAATPPEGPIETRGGWNLLPSPSACGLGLRIGSIEATGASTSVAARQLACRPQSGFVDGLQLPRRSAEIDRVCLREVARSWNASIPARRAPRARPPTSLVHPQTMGARAQWIQPLASSAQVGHSCRANPVNFPRAP